MADSDGKRSIPLILGNAAPKQTRPLTAQGRDRNLPLDCSWRVSRDRFRGTQFARRSQLEADERDSCLN
jgi:hypothetical protein